MLAYFFPSKARRNSSGLMSACLKIPLSVPMATLLWSGTTHPRSPERRTMWLPFCRTGKNPNTRSAARICALEVRGNLGMRHIEGCHKRVRTYCAWEFFQKELGGLFQILQRFMNRCTLTDRTHFWALCNEDSLFFMNNCSKHIYSIPYSSLI